MTEVLIDDLDRVGAPAESTSAFAQRVLAMRGLTMLAHLLGRRLSEAHDRVALEMRVADLVAHCFPPRPLRDRFEALFAPAMPARRAPVGERPERRLPTRVEPEA